MEHTLVNIKCMASSLTPRQKCQVLVCSTHIIEKKCRHCSHDNADFIALGESYQIIGRWPMEI